MRLLLPGKWHTWVPLRHHHTDMLLSCLSSPHLSSSAAHKRELISWRSSLFWSAGNSLGMGLSYSSVSRMHTVVCVFLRLKVCMKLETRSLFMFLITVGMSYNQNTFLSAETPVASMHWGLYKLLAEMAQTWAPPTTSQCWQRLQATCE